MDNESKEAIEETTTLADRMQGIDDRLEELELSVFSVKPTMIDIFIAGFFAGVLWVMLVRRMD